MQFFIDGALITTEEAGSTAELGSIILQGINSIDGVDRDLYFDNFEASAEDVPAPSAFLLVLTGLLALGVTRRPRAVGTA